MFANYFGAVCNKVKFIQRSLRKISMRNFENKLTNKIDQLFRKFAF